MQDFAEASQMKRVALFAIAVQLDQSDIEHPKLIFQELDTDGNGSISMDELRAVNTRVDMLTGILKGADTDGNGTINYTEFLAATMNQ
jgi:calcium-dependent protein kinase